MDKKYVVVFCSLSISVPSTIYENRSLWHFFKALQFTKRLQHTRYAFPRNRAQLYIYYQSPLLLLPRTPTPLIPKLISRYGINNGIVGKYEWSSNERTSAAVLYDPITTVVCRDCVSTMLNLTEFWYCLWLSICSKSTNITCYRPVNLSENKLMEKHISAKKVIFIWYHLQEILLFDIIDSWVM